ncbi:MAG: hypothetical protein Q7R95_04105 [bacterium]|nr:hypothetical protein [bacterium]
MKFNKKLFLIFLTFIIFVVAIYLIYSYSRFLYNKKQLNKCSTLVKGNGFSNLIEDCKYNFDKTYWQVFTQPFIDIYGRIYNQTHPSIQ